MAKKLTELMVARATGKPGRQVDMTDGLVPGLSLRVGERTKSWNLLYRVHGRQRRLKLGTWPAVGLADARKLAKEALLRAAQGEDPAAERRSVAANSFEAVAAEFVERYVKRRHKRARETEQMIAGKLLPVWSGRPITGIGRRDILAVLDTELAAGRERTAGKLHSLLRRLFGWCREQGIVEANPLADVGSPARVVQRDRVLSDAELGRIWHAAAKMGWPWAGLIHLLTCTALRRDEIARLRWSELDTERGVLMLGGERTKSGRPQETPLSTLATEIVDRLPRIENSAGYVFPAARHASANPVSGFSRMKRRLDAVSDVSGWKVHDLRRTAASAMARAGVAPQVLSRVLNHSAGPALPGVLAVYAVHSYDREARAALELWGRELERIVGRGEAKVVPLRGTR